MCGMKLRAKKIRAKIRAIGRCRIAPNKIKTIAPAIKERIVFINK